MKKQTLFKVFQCIRFLQKDTDGFVFDKFDVPKSGAGIPGAKLEGEIRKAAADAKIDTAQKNLDKVQVDSRVAAWQELHENLKTILGAQKTNNPDYYVRVMSAAKLGTYVNHAIIGRPNIKEIEAHVGEDTLRRLFAEEKGFKNAAEKVAAALGEESKVDWAQVCAGHPLLEKVFNRQLVAQKERLSPKPKVEEIDIRASARREASTGAQKSIDYMNALTAEHPWSVTIKNKAAELAATLNEFAAKHTPGNREIVLMNFEKFVNETAEKPDEKTSKIAWGKMLDYLKKISTQYTSNEGVQRLISDTTTKLLDKPEGFGAIATTFQLELGKLTTQPEEAAGTAVAAAPGAPPAAQTAEKTPKGPREKPRLSPDRKLQVTQRLLRELGVTRTDLPALAELFGMPKKQPPAEYTAEEFGNQIEKLQGEIWDQLPKDKKVELGKGKFGTREKFADGMFGGITKDALATLIAQKETLRPATHLQTLAAKLSSLTTPREAVAATAPTAAPEKAAEKAKSELTPEQELELLAFALGELKLNKDVNISKDGKAVAKLPKDTPLTILSYNKDEKCFYGSTLVTTPGGGLTGRKYFFIPKDAITIGDAEKAIARRHYEQNSTDFTNMYARVTGKTAEALPAVAELFKTPIEIKTAAAPAKPAAAPAAPTAATSTTPPKKPTQIADRENPPRPTA